MMQFRRDVNGMRAVAVLAVVFYHFGVPGFAGGFVGVDVFFVISGFLMTQIISGQLEQGRFSLLDFYLARARRIVPALAALVLVLIGAGFFWLTPLDYAELGQQAAAALVFVSNFTFARESGYFDAATHTNWLLHTWSLSLEWQFYLVFPVLLYALARLRQQAATWIALTALALASFAFCWYETAAAPVRAFYWPIGRVWEFLAGALAFHASRNYACRPLLVPVGLVLILASVAGYSDRIAFPGAWAAVPVLGAALVIAGKSDFVAWRIAPLQHLGRISYSVYLWHWPVYVAARYMELTLGPLSVAALIALSVMLGWISYAWVESPFRHQGRFGWRSMSGRAGIFGGLVACAFGVYASSGVPERIPDRARTVIAANDALRKQWPFPEACHIPMASLQSAPGSDYCARGPARPGKVLIWGDSHAEHLYPAMEILAQDAVAGAQPLWATRGGCLPVRGLERIDDGYHCAGLNDLFFKRASQADVRAVVLASIWTVYFEGVGYYDGVAARHQDPLICVAPQCTTFAGPSEAMQFARRQLEADVGTLMQHGKQVYLVLPVPAYRVPVAAHLAKAQLAPWMTPLKLSREDHDGYTARVRAMLAEIAGRTGAKLLDPADVLCGNGACQFQRQGVSLYKDAHHLAPAGAALLSPLLASSMKKLG